MESPRSHPQHSPSRALPSISSLTNGLPPTSQPSPHSISHSYHQSRDSFQQARDSGAWITSQSKHSSLTNGNNGGAHLSSLLNPDDSQNRPPSTPAQGRPPNTQTLPSLNQGFDANGQADHIPRQSGDYHATSGSRRSSVDSRVHSGFNQLALSPYESQHASQLSLASSLRRPDGAPQPPFGFRGVNRAHEARKAPAIVPDPRRFGAPDPTSARPTQGFPWAFPDTASRSPDERVERRSSSSESSDGQKTDRRESFGESVRSSVLSAELPAGQRRFDDGMGFQKIIGTVNLKHDSQMQHQMPHRVVTQLQHEHANNLAASGGYSRTPELRVSHKLAERKRRSEMKDLFEELNKAVPANGGAKASKWEILSKAIDHIRASREQERALLDEIQRLRGDLEYARDLHKDNDHLRTEICVMHERLRRLEPSTPHIYGAYTSSLSQPGQGSAQQQSSRHHPHQSSGLPSVNGTHSHQQQQQHLSHAAAPYSAPMQGVEYTLPNRPSYEVR